MRSKDIISQSLTQKISIIIFLFFTVSIAVLLKIFSAIIIQSLVDNVFGLTVAEHPKLAFSVGAFVVTIVLWFLIEIFNKNQAITLGTHVTSSLSKAVYSSCIRAEIGELEKLEKEDIVKRITKDCSNIGNNFIGTSWVNFWSEIITIIGIFIAMMILNPYLGLITYVALPLFYMIVRNFDRYVKKIDVKAKKDLEAREKKIAENFEKVRSIKLKNGIIQEEEVFDKNNEHYINIQKEVNGLSEINQNKIFHVLVNLLLSLVLGIGGYISTRNSAIVGTIVAFMVLIPYVYSSFRNVMSTSISFSNVETEIESLDQLLSLKSEIKSEPINNLDDIHNLRFQDVTYMGNNNNSIETLNFELRRGEKLGIISLEGISTDTIFDLLTKLIKPKEGMISINNCDINKISTLYLRDIVTAIPQERCLFNDTIANNITYPLEFDEYKYNDALNKSGLKDIIAELEEKDQTIIDEEHKLSEEIMQRITFANAFYKDSKIFVLNEATSCLDIRDEEAIMKEIHKLKNKMVIIMSNKIYNVVNCDKVLIVERDQVVEYGKVQDLLDDRNSMFSRMVKKVKVTKNAKVS